MDKYINLDKFNRKYPKKDIESELKKRKYAYGTLNTNLFIKSKSKTEQKPTFELFSVNNYEIIKLKSKIYKNSKNILKLSSKLPDIIKNKFIFKLLANEILSNNKIEGVRSTKKEIIDAIDSNNNSSNSKKRFVSLVNQYMLILDETYTTFNTPKDIRNLYDLLLEDEIHEKDKPDGMYFRNGSVRIGNDIETIHEPKTTESDILEQIYTLIEFKNKYIEDDPLVVSAIMHYYFEYIHPFYDGNGRLGRFIYCSQIAQYLDKYSSICLSHAIQESKEKYYKEFDNVPNIRNYGEITLFVQMMLSYLNSGQESIIEYLEEALSYDNFISECIRKANFSDIQTDIIYILLMSYKFDINYDEGISKNEYITAYYERNSTSKQKIKQELLDLENKNILVRIKKRPIRYILSDEYLNSLINKD